MTTTLSGSPLQPKRLFRDSINCLHKVPKCAQSWRSCSRCCFGLHISQNYQFGHLVFHIPLTEVVSHVPPSQLCQLVSPPLHLPNTVHAVLYRVGDCAHHWVRFIISARLAKLCILFFIFHHLPSLLIIRSCKIAQTVYDSTQQLLKWVFRIACCWSCFFSSSHIFLLFHNCRLSSFNLHSYHSGLSINIILNPFLFGFVAETDHFSAVFCRNPHCRSYAAQCSQHSNDFVFQVALGFFPLLTWSCGLYGRFAVFAHQKWRKILYQSINHCTVWWHCCRVRCWMLQDMDRMEARCIFHVNVGRFIQLKERKICVLTIALLKIVRLTVHHDLMVNLWSMYDPGDLLRQSSPDIPSVEECSSYINQPWDFSCCSLQ
jgi:hypothetical protein